MPIPLPSRRSPEPCRTALALAVAAPLLLAAAVPARAQNAVAVGLWYDDTGKGAVEITPCGAKLCGRIVWLKDPISEKTGKPLVDAHNPEPAQRSRTICGLQILGDLARQADGTWDAGWVYDPKVGKSYDASIEVQGARLTLTGYKGIKLFSKSFTWTKAPADLPRCNVASPANGAEAAPIKPR